MVWMISEHKSCQPFALRRNNRLILFEKILGKTYAAFKKDQINERVEKLGKLKPITINYNGK